jgi:hypothetical protein
MNRQINLICSESILTRTFFSYSYATVFLCVIFIIIREEYFCTLLRKKRRQIYYNFDNLSAASVQSVLEFMKLTFTFIKRVIYLWRREVEKENFLLNQQQ